MWNYERELPEMEAKVDRMVKEINTNYVDVMVAHAPVYQTLDLTRSNAVIGSQGSLKNLCSKGRSGSNPLLSTMTI